MPRKYAVRLLKLLLCQLHLFASAVGIAVKGCHIELLLCLKIIHCVIHNVAHGLLLRFAPRGIGGLCAVLCVVDDAGQMRGYFPNSSGSHIIAAPASSQPFEWQARHCETPAYTRRIPRQEKNP